MADLQLTGKEKHLGVKLAILFGLAYGAVFGAEKLVTQYTADVLSTNNTLKEELASFRGRLSEINDEELLQSQYVDSYNSYRNRNLILGPDVVTNSELAAKLDEEQRLYVLERLQQIKGERKFFEIDYSLSQPDNLPASFSNLTDDSNVAIRSNKMTIKMPLLHSLDLLMMLNDFYDPIDNRFTPVRCTMTFEGEDRTDNGSDSSLLTLKNNIASSCTLVWLSVFDPQLGAPEEEQPEASS